MPDPRLLPLLDLIAASIAAAVIAEQASGDSLSTAVDRDGSRKQGGQPAPDAPMVRPGCPGTEAA